jgi:hypothetical protein
VLAIPPTIGRARLRQTAAGLRIFIPVQRSAYRFFLSLGTAIFIIWALELRHEDSNVVLLMAAIMILANIARNVFWNLMGEEIVTINKSALTLRYDVWGVGWTRTHFLDRVSALRFNRLVTRQELQEGSDTPHIGFVEFDYGSNTRRFGRGLSEAEAQEIIASIRSYTGVPLTATRVPVSHHAPGGILAEEINRNLGVTYVMWMLAGVLYFLGTLLDDTAPRLGAYLFCLLFAGVGTVAAAGYRYRFTNRGIEISTLGIRLRFIPVDRITHYEQTRLTFADNFSVSAERRSYLWVGIPIRIQTLDGEFLLGHMKPAILLHDLELMKQASTTDHTLTQATAAGAH